MDYFDQFEQEALMADIIVKVANLTTPSKASLVEVELLEWIKKERALAKQISMTMIQQKVREHINFANNEMDRKEKEVDPMNLCQ